MPLRLCAPAHGGAGGDDRRLLAEARRAGLVRHPLPGGAGRQRPRPRRYDCADGGDGPGAALLGERHGSWPALARVLDRATVALCAEMCGGAQQVLDMTTAYAKIRIAFGKPIGSYQGVKHQAADMLVAIENAKSLTYYAAWAVDQGLDEAPLAVSMAKAAASDMYRKVAGTGIQLHGGIGMTWEHDLQLYFKRAKASEVAFGDATWHRERVAQLISF